MVLLRDVANVGIVEELWKLCWRLSPRRELSSVALDKVSNIAVPQGIDFLFRTSIISEEIIHVDPSHRRRLDQAYQDAKSELSSQQRPVHRTVVGDMDEAKAPRDEVDEICLIICDINHHVRFLNPDEMLPERTAEMIKLIKLSALSISHLLKLLSADKEALKVWVYPPKTFPKSEKFLELSKSLCSMLMKSAVDALADQLSRLSLDSSEYPAVNNNIFFTASICGAEAKPSCIMSPISDEKETITQITPESKVFNSRGIRNPKNACWCIAPTVSLGSVLHPLLAGKNISRHLSLTSSAILRLIDALNQSHAFEERRTFMLQRLTFLIEHKLEWHIDEQQDAGQFVKWMLQETDLSRALSLLGLTPQVDLLLVTECKSCRHSEREEKTVVVFEAMPETSEENDYIVTLLVKFAEQLFCYHRKCCNCGSNDITGTYSFLTVPELLVVHIVRGSLSGKVRTALDLTEPLVVLHNGTKYIYHLKAVMCHLGDGCKSGHFYAYTCGDSEDPEAIYKRNDSQVDRLIMNEYIRDDIKKNGVIALYCKEFIYERMETS